MQRVNRPKGGHINVWLRWLPVSVHKQLDCLVRHVQSDWRRLPLSHLVTRYLGDASSTLPEPKTSGISRGEYGLRALAMDDRPVPEADAARIAALAQEDVDRYFPGIPSSRLLLMQPWIRGMLKWISWFLKFLVVLEAY